MKVCIKELNMAVKVTDRYNSKKQCTHEVSNKVGQTNVQILSDWSNNAIHTVVLCISIFNLHSKLPLPQYDR